MGVLDKFLSIMRLDDYEDDDNFFDQDYEDEVEEKTKKRNFFKRDKDVDDIDDIEEDSYERKSRGSRTASANKVTPMRPTARKTTGMEVCVIKPTVVDDAREIAETLLSGRTVILNFEGLDLEIAQRIIDFTSGATFSIDGNLQKISNYIFLVTPTNVDISGDLQDLLNSSFDVPSIKTRF